MKTITVSTWDQFMAEISSLDERRAALAKEHAALHVSDLLFRGQSDASWYLATTLERAVGEGVKVLEYYLTITGIQAEVESFTGREWKTIDYFEYDTFLSETKLNILPQPIYEYMVHLRHHGFPSPLLDWTTSPFIAAYFAFRNPQTTADKVAVFAYLEYSGGAKAGMEGAPRIDSMGPHVRAHTRHFLQRCQYTLCFNKVGERHRYAPHESVFKSESKTQDLLWKIEMPAVLQPVALGYLDRVNINSFSLFGSEDALMEACATREYILNPGESAD